MIFLSFIFLSPVFAADFETNALSVRGAPSWVKRTKVEKVTASIQMKLEWTIRKLNLQWHSNSDSFAQAHGLGPQALAVTQSKNQNIHIHIGPRVNESNYQQVLGHELVHVILRQKYKNSIPKWLEEGLANHLSKKAPVDYKWLSQQKIPQDIQQLAHPFKGSPTEVQVRYVASQALAEMLDKKCDLQNLIRLSVERKMEDYIRRTCEISNINSTFKMWIQSRSKLATQL